MYEIIKKTRATPNTKFVYEFRGKSSYTKPTSAKYPDMALGSVLYDIDTKSAYMYDRDIDAWIQQ